MSTQANPVFDFQPLTAQSSPATERAGRGTSGPMAAPSTPSAPPAAGFDFRPLSKPTDPPVEPGGFGPYDEASEGHLFTGPLHKGVDEGISMGFGLKKAKEPMLSAMSDTWNNLVQGAKDSYQRVHEAMGGEDESGLMALPGMAIDAALTPIEMIASGIEGTSAMLTHGAAEIKNGYSSGPNGTMDKQRIGRGVGMILASLGQVAMGMEGGEVGEAVGEKTGNVLAKRARNPGAEMVRANSEKNYMFSKDPGRALQPFKIDGRVVAIRPVATLESLSKQIDQVEGQLHSSITQKLAAADTKRAIMPDGTLQTVPNLLDHVTQIQNAAEETLREIQQDKGLGSSRKILVKAVNDAKDDILQEHDINGEALPGEPQPKTPTEVNDLKKKIGRKGDWGLYSSADEVAKADVLNRFTHKAYGKLNELVDTAVGGPSGSMIRELNSHYADLIEFRKLLDKRLALERGTGGLQKMIRGGEWMGAIGAILSGNPLLREGGMVALANRVARSTPMRIVRARAFAAAPEALANVGQAAGAAAPVAGASGRTDDMAQRVLGGGQ